MKKTITRFSFIVNCILILNFGSLIAKNITKDTDGVVLFLFDLSGSMNDSGNDPLASKLQEAKAAAHANLTAMNNTNVIYEYGVLGFSGSCPTTDEDCTTGNPYFTTQIDLITNKIDNLTAGGGTPLKEAIEIAQCKLANRLESLGITNGKLIVLSDGESTCNKTRPDNVYAYGSNENKNKYSKSAATCKNNSEGLRIKINTIGFNLGAGSVAERDLQYIANSNGGKYYNSEGKEELEKAFYKLTKIYQPKDLSIKGKNNSSFNHGIDHIKNELFEDGLVSFEKYVKTNPNDYNGIYNLALMQEANGYFGQSIDNYQKYIDLNPDAPDKEFIHEYIARITIDFEDQKAYYFKLIQKDKEYVQKHFEQIQNGNSITLATDFKLFLLERGDFYEQLDNLLYQDNEELLDILDSIQYGLEQCSDLIRDNPNEWDRDATPPLSILYLTLEELESQF